MAESWESEFDKFIVDIANTKLWSVSNKGDIMVFCLSLMKDIDAKKMFSIIGKSLMLVYDCIDCDIMKGFVDNYINYSNSNITCEELDGLDFDLCRKIPEYYSEEDDDWYLDDYNPNIWTCFNYFVQDDKAEFTHDEVLQMMQDIAKLYAEDKKDGNLYEEALSKIADICRSVIDKDFLISMIKDNALPKWYYTVINANKQIPNRD